MAAQPFARNERYGCGVPPAQPFATKERYGCGVPPAQPFATKERHGCGVPLAGIAGIAGAISHAVTTYCAHGIVTDCNDRRMNRFRSSYARAHHNKQINQCRAGTCPRRVQELAAAYKLVSTYRGRLIAAPTRTGRIRAVGAAISRPLAGTTVCVQITVCHLRIRRGHVPAIQNSTLSNRSCTLR